MNGYKKSDLKPNRYIIYKSFDRFFNKYTLWLDQIKTVCGNGVYVSSRLTPIKPENIISCFNDYSDAQIMFKSYLAGNILLQENADLNFNKELKLVV